VTYRSSFVTSICGWLSNYASMSTVAGFIPSRRPALLHEPPGRLLLIALRRRVLDSRRWWSLKGHHIGPRVLRAGRGHLAPAQSSNDDASEITSRQLHVARFAYLRGRRPLGTICHRLSSRSPAVPQSAFGPAALVTRLHRIIFDGVRWLGRP
jgi:hypothetical protein